MGDKGLPAAWGYLFFRERLFQCQGHLPEYCGERQARRPPAAGAAETGTGGGGRREEQQNRQRKLAMDKKCLILGVFGVLCIWIPVRAQDTTKRRTIDITSSFKPVLREAVKINFNAQPPAADTSRPHLSYNIPAQYLSLSYTPSEMKPVALQRDSMSPWVNY